MHIQVIAEIFFLLRFSFFSPDSILVLAARDFHTIKISYILFYIVILCVNNYLSVSHTEIQKHTYRSTYSKLYAYTESLLLEGDTCPSTMCQEVLCLAGWPTVARPAVRYGPVRLALTPAHLPELTRLLPHHLSRRTKCAMVSWQSSPKCQPGVTNPCRPLGPRRPGSVGSCPGSDGEPGTCHGNNNH